jgi:hypothetical protein
MLKVLAVTIVLTILLANTSLAFQCPLLLKQLADAAAIMNASEPKVKEGQALLAEAKKLHEAGKHAESIATAENAARVLGLQLKRVKMNPAQEEQVRAAEQKIRD